MDRREALKKLGAGGAVAAGATLVTSQQAFAYDNPSKGLNPSVSATGVDDNKVTITVTGLGTATCPASANDGPNPPTPNFMSVGLSNGPLSGPAGPYVLALGSAAGPELPTSATSMSFTIFKTNAGNTANRKYRSGEQIFITVNVSFTCQYQGDVRMETFPTSFTATSQGVGGPWVVS